MELNNNQSLQNILESIIFASVKPITEQQLLAIFEEHERPSLADLRQAIFHLQKSYTEKGIELIATASGYQFQTKVEYASYLVKLFEEKPAKYSRALLETLALIAYRQPITRGEIEDIRGVSISTSIFKTLLEERNWIRVVGRKEIPGRPGLYATTDQFLEYFKLKSLDKLPSLPEILQLSNQLETEITAELVNAINAPVNQNAIVIDSEEIDNLSATELQYKHENENEFELEEI